MAGRRKKMRSHIWLKAHSIATLFFLVLYLLLGFAPNPRLGRADLKDKYQVLAAELSMVQRIYGPPQKPVVTAAPGCSGHSPRVQLDWPADSETISYDIFRDEAELVSGVAGASYIDAGVSNLSDYSYYVVANGFSRTETSDAAAVTTLDCGEALPEPEIEITKINNKLTGGQNGTPKIEDRTPAFEGATNIPYAIVHLEIHSDPIIIATVAANENGYWRWTVPQNLPYGNHILYITATDPEDPERFTQASQHFKVIREENNDEDNGEESESGGEEQTAGPSQNIWPGAGTESSNPEEITKPSIFQPFQLSLAIENRERQIFQGDVLKLQSFLSETDLLAVGQKARVSYAVINALGETVYSEESETVILPGADLGKSIPVSLLMKPGRYTARVEVLSGNYSVSQERQFSVERKPLVAFGGNINLTYSEIVEKIGWISITMAVVLVFIFLLFLFEYYLAKRGIHIDERDLKKRGLIS